MRWKIYLSFVGEAVFLDRRVCIGIGEWMRLFAEALNRFMNLDE